MSDSDIRRSNPVLNVKQVRDKGKPKLDAKLRHNIRKEIDPEYVAANIKAQRKYNENNPYDSLSEEQKINIRKSIKKHIAKKLTRSSRFASMYKRYKNKHKYPTKICIDCGEEKTLNFFDNRNDKNLNIQMKNRHQQRRSYCYVCRAKRNREYYLKNKEKWRHINDT